MKPRRVKRSKQGARQRPVNAAAKRRTRAFFPPLALLAIALLASSATLRQQQQAFAASTMQAQQQQQQQQATVVAPLNSHNNNNNKQNNYYGTLIGKLNRRDHNVSGEVYAVDEQTLFIKSFNYDGLAPDAYFWSSVTSGQPSADGFIVPDEKGSTKPLERYQDKDVVLRLPEGKTLREINWLSIWSRHNKQNSGEILIAKQLIIPRPLEIGPFSSLAHGLKSAPITIVDAQTFLVPDFHYDGLGPEAYFWLTRGSQGLNGNGLRLKDENGSGAPLRKYAGETVVITLPEDLTIYDFDYFGVWCVQFSVNFGQTRIPQLARVPPSPKMLGIKPENKLNCEILYDDLGYEIRWVLDGDDIVMQLVGKIEPNEYMAFGLGKDDSKSDMNNADAVVTWVDRQSGQVHAVDYFLGSKQQCVNDPLTGSCPDVKLANGGDSLTLLHGAIVNGYSMVTFKRPQLGIDEQYDQHVYSDGQQSVIWAIGQLNAKKEIGYHRLKTRQNMFIDFARNPQWNCPIPDLNASIHNNLPISSAASQIDPTVVSVAASVATPSNNGGVAAQLDQPSAGSRVSPRVEMQGAQSSATGLESPPRVAPFGSGAGVAIGDDESATELSRDVQPSTPPPFEMGGGAVGSPPNAAASNRTVINPEPNAAPWFIPSIACPADRTFYAQIGPTAGHKGYEGVTGRSSWGVCWYVNGLMIPELVVERGQTYRFVVEGGNDKTSATRRHPFYLTDSPEGGFDFKTDDERLKERIFGGVALRPDGQFVPTAEGRLCEWKQTNATQANPDNYATFSAYQRSLKMECLPGQASMLKFTPDATTPELVYYQCYTHRFMGWRIRVVNSCQAYLSSLQQPARALSSNNNNLRRNTRSGKTRSLNSAAQVSNKSVYKRRSLVATNLLDTLRLAGSEPRTSFETPVQNGPQQDTSLMSGLEFGDDAVGSSMSEFSTALPSDLLVLNNSHLANFQRQPANLSSFEEILKLAPGDVEFVESAGQAANSAGESPLDALFLQSANLAAASELLRAAGPPALPLHTFANLSAANSNNVNKTATKAPKTLQSYMRRLASIYYPVQQQLANMLASQSQSQPSLASAQQPQASTQSAALQLVPSFMQPTLVQVHPTPPPSAQQAQQGEQPATSGGFSLSNLVPKSKIDLSKSTISKKLNKLRFKSGRKYEPSQASSSQQQQLKQAPPTPANEFNYDIFNNHLAQLEKQQKQFQTLEMANWPSSSAATSDTFNYLPMMSMANVEEQPHQNPFDAMSQLHSSQMFLNNLMNGNQQQQQQQQQSYMAPPKVPMQQTMASNMYQSARLVQQQQPQQQPYFRQPLRFAETPLGPPNQQGQQPYVLDYLSLGLNRTAPAAQASEPNQVNGGQQVRYANLPSFGPDNAWIMNALSQVEQRPRQQQQQQQQQQQPQQQQQQQQHHSYTQPQQLQSQQHYAHQQQPAVFITRVPQHQTPVYSRPAPVQNQQQQHLHKLWSSALPPSSSARYPSIQPYKKASNNNGAYTALEQEYTQNGNQMSTMPSVTLSIHDTQPEGGAYQQQAPDPQHQQEAESLNGSGSGAHYDVRQRPAHQDQLQLQSADSASRGAGGPSNEPADHMMAIERFSKQSSERRPPSVVHPITGEQILHFQQDGISQSNYSKSQLGQHQRPRFSAMLIDKHIVASSGEPTQPREILEVDQTMHQPSQDLQRINNSSEPGQHHHQIVLINVDSDKIQRFGSSTSNASNAALITLHGQQLVSGEPTNYQPATTESAVLVRPAASEGSVAEGARNATPSSTTVATTSVAGSTSGPLVPSVGPPTMQQAQGANNFRQDNSNNNNELVVKSTLVEPNFIHNPSLGPPQSLNLFAPAQYFSRPAFDSSPFTPIELASQLYYGNQQQQQQQRMRPPPLIESMLSQHHHQSLYPRPEPPVQVASFLAQHLTSHNPMFISSEKSVASSQPMALSVSVPTSSSSLMPTKSPTQNEIHPNNNSHNSPNTNDLIILKPALLTKQAPQTYLLKPEYITNQFTLSHHPNDHHNSVLKGQGDLYYPNEIPNEPSRRIAGNQFDRLSSLSSPPSTSIALDPMQTATNMAISTYIKQGAALLNNSFNLDHHNTDISGRQQQQQQQSSNTGDRAQEKSSNATFSRAGSAMATTTKDTNVTTINIDAIQTTSADINNKPAQHRQSLVPSKPIPLSFEPISSFSPDGVRMSPSGGVGNLDNLHADNNTDNAILSHVMSLISSNAIPTPPLIPVASYSSADYFLPLSDRIHRSIRG